MKSILSVFLLLLMVAGCTENTTEMVLTGHVKGLKKGTLLLQKVDDSTLVSVDSVTVDGDSNFKFTRAIESPEVYYLYLRLKDGTLIDDRIPFFAESGALDIQTDLNNFSLKANVTGSENETLYQKYISQMQRYSDKNLELIEQNFKAKQTGNDSLVQALEQQQSSMRKSRYLATVNFAKNHKEYEVAPYLMLTQAGAIQSSFNDTIYNLLPKRIQESKYGEELRLHLKSSK